MLGSLAILGMPPFGVFASEFLILTTAMREHPWTTPFLLIALGVAFAAIFSRVQPMVFGESDAPPLPHSPALVPVFRSSRHGADAWPLYAAGARSVVSRRGTADRVIGMISCRLSSNSTRTPTPGEHAEQPGLCVDREQWLRPPMNCAQAGACLLTLWGADDRDRDRCFRVYAAFLLPDTLMVVEHKIAGEHRHPIYPSIASLVPGRVCAWSAPCTTCSGSRAAEPDNRGWLRHGGWPETYLPSAAQMSMEASNFAAGSEPYPFVAVEGDGVHEIAVGPVHAGTIEPGHFRFSVVGEKVLRLEERLGYTHKGVAKRFEELSQQAKATAWPHASPAIPPSPSPGPIARRWKPSPTSACPVARISLRALALEHERLANHLGDLGALGNDAGFAFGLTQFLPLERRPAARQRGRFRSALPLRLHNRPEE